MGTSIQHDLASIRGSFSKKTPLYKLACIIGVFVFSSSLFRNSSNLAGGRGKDYRGAIPSRFSRSTRYIRGIDGHLHSIGSYFRENFSWNALQSKISGAYPCFRYFLPPAGGSL
jgi:hypothetical protein